MMMMMMMMMMIMMTAVPILGIVSSVEPCFVVTFVGVTTLVMPHTVWPTLPDTECNETQLLPAFPINIHSPRFISRFYGQYFLEDLPCALVIEKLLF